MPCKNCFSVNTIFLINLLSKKFLNLYKAKQINILIVREFYLACMKIPIWSIYVPDIQQKHLQVLHVAERGCQPHNGGVSDFGAATIYFFLINKKL